MKKLGVTGLLTLRGRFHLLIRPMVYYVSVQDQLFVHYAWVVPVSINHTGPLMAFMPADHEPFLPHDGQQKAVTDSRLTAVLAWRCFFMQSMSRWL